MTILPEQPEHNKAENSEAEDRKAENSHAENSHAENSHAEAGSISEVSGGQVNLAGRDVRQVEAGTYIEHATYITQAVPPEGKVETGPAPGEPPYKGLQYFDVADAGRFFGRQALTAGLVARLRETRFLAVVGASGSGKSSVVRAGLVPALQKGEPLADGTLPPAGSAGWQVRIITPSAHPLRELATTLAGDQESLTAVTTLMDDLQHDVRCLDLAVSKTLKRLSGERLLLVVDQFEELFTLCREAGERKAFVDNLLAAASDETGGSTLVLITLRADFYHHCAQYPGLPEVLSLHQKYIEPMNQVELRQAIEEPARLGGWELEPGLVDLMLREVGDEPGGLPLLSHALLETWRRRTGRRLTLAGYQQAGGVHGAIALTADRVYQALKPGEQAIARSIFLRLTELGEGTQDTRRRAELSELISDPAQQAGVDGVLKALADARLVTTAEHYAEVAHEALIREWPALRGWLDKDREGLRLHRHLGEAAQDWEKMQRDSGDLYRGARLAQALEWGKDHPGELSPLEREFLAAGQAVQQRAMRSRWAAWIGVILGLLVTTIAVTLGATGQLNHFIYRPLPIEWAGIPAGEFLMGCDQNNLNEHCGRDELPQHAVSLDAFQMMKYEVTNRQYVQCVKAGECTPPSNQSYADTGSSNLPVTDVDWEKALAFCTWVGGRLPSEAEWEKAARGGLDGKLYPWGDEAPVCELGAQNGASFNGCDSLGVRPVGSFAPNGYGLYDMAGNVWEWVLDWYGADYYASSPHENPPGPQSGAFRLERGGAWDFDPGHSRTSLRLSIPAGFRGTGLGIRCARRP